MSDETPDDGGDGPEIERRAHERRLARGLVAAARRALGLARRYRSEEGPRGGREVACVAQALAWRAEARTLRNRVLPDVGPGVARAVPHASQDEAARRAG